MKKNMVGTIKLYALLLLYPLSFAGIPFFNSLYNKIVEETLRIYSVYHFITIFTIAVFGFISALIMINAEKMRYSLFMKILVLVFTVVSMLFFVSSLIPFLSFPYSNNVTVTPMVWSLLRFSVGKILLYFWPFVSVYWIMMCYLVFRPIKTEIKDKV